MKKTILFSGLVLLTAAFKPLSDACASLSFFSEGTQSTMTNFDEKGEMTGKTVTLYSKITATDKGTNISASQESFDHKNRSTGKNEFTIRCENSSLYFDMRMFIPQDQMKAYKDMEMTVEGNDMEFPATISEGSVLKDASVNIKVSSNGTPMPMMGFAINVTNRKVEKKESVTTAAGTYDCFKITDDVEVKSIMKIRMKTISWFSPVAGIVKTESYKENGKMVGKSELTELKK
ncbi:MAG: hypothetical protein K0R65_1923 [Crocinitomicaceae bacterium]|jgi:hypothetical protein|nr:hypothetical protein [Crocinitomicaceae bacterium]